HQPPAHPHLHSFPTRRSSDLMSWANTVTGSEDPGLHPLNQFPLPPATVTVACVIYVFPPALTPVPLSIVTSFSDSQLRKITSPLDRKSTRLNSSHVKISYAVF